jgi:hypothetical protein
MKSMESIVKWEYEHTAKVIPIKPETTSNAVIVHYTYTIRITEVGNGRGRSKACGTSCFTKNKNKKKKKKKILWQKPQV